MAKNPRYSNSNSNGTVTMGVVVSMIAVIMVKMAMTPNAVVAKMSVTMVMLR
jgi:uncharacterized membrane protein YgaE (UPF0421/DUF939 family)